jgi:transcriptional regulator with GAF, ATPase, and Fis domain
MAMREGSPRSKRAIRVDLADFAWDPFALATLRHPSLPWYDQFATAVDVTAIPLSEVDRAAERSLLSLVGQFAAHQALLRFAALEDGGFSADEWAVIVRRGVDCRLVRLRAEPGPRGQEPPPAVALIEAFAQAIDAPRQPILQRSWARPESVYVDIDRRLRSDSAADLRWFRCAAWGSVASPGPAMLRSIFTERSGRLIYCDPMTIESLHRASLLHPHRPVLQLGGPETSPLRRHSALSDLEISFPGIMSLGESEVVEHIAQSLEKGPLTVIVRDFRSFDPSSRRVLHMLGSFDRIVWVVPEEMPAVPAQSESITLPATSYFVVAPTTTAMRRFEQEILESLPLGSRASFLQDLVVGAGYASFLHHGALPAIDEPLPSSALIEPRRSYLAALAVLGGRVPVDLARDILARINADLSVEELCEPGIGGVEHGEMVLSPSIRRLLATAIPPEVRKEFALSAAERAAADGKWLTAASLLVEAQEPQLALLELERSSEWSAAEAAEVVALVNQLDEASLAASPKATFRVAQALIEAGRYDDAVRMSHVLKPEASSLVQALANRRTGDYASATKQLQELEAAARSFAAELLLAELQRLQQIDAEAALARAARLAEAAEQKVRLGYERAVQAIEASRPADEEWLSVVSSATPYLASRYQTYQAVEADEPDQACLHAAESVRLARTVVQQIDARLDHLFALFLRGRWQETRREALETLAVVEETQGDRAAGGILFTLAYLAADEGQWAGASQRIERLRTFYRATRDAKRLHEIALLEAHLALGRAEFAAARSLANSLLLESGISLQLREAAHLILDEIDWIEGTLTDVRTSGRSRCRELADRHWVNVSRRGGDCSSIEGQFSRSLAAWEHSTLEGALSDPPQPGSGSERLRLVRSLHALARRLSEPRLQSMALELCRELDISLPPIADPRAESYSSVEARIIRIAATREFPFQRDDFDGLLWRFATRNRLGQWTEIGSLAPLDGDELDGILAAPMARDWMECGERELLYIQDSARWAADSRDAVRQLFRTRSEHYRLKRAAEQDQIVRQVDPAAIAGMIGDSPQMKEVFALVARVARREVPVCVFGESGTGKELVASALHRSSSRRSKPFVAINCAALPENLIESELFGHARGAFTGADRERAGLIETSDGGTLFLDEIGEMPLTAQAKLLRFLQEGEFRRVGETAMRTADVRVVAATNRSLEQFVDAGCFRQDLYYRIRGVEIVLPPLRERAADIPPLSRHFLAREHERHRGGARRMSVEVEAVFRSYSWPGNVRELQNTIRAAHALAGDDPEIELEHLPARLQSVIVAPATNSYQQELVRFRRALIERSLRDSSGNQNQAAKRLGMSRQALAYQIRELGILVRDGDRPRRPSS